MCACAVRTDPVVTVSLAGHMQSCPASVFEMRALCSVQCFLGLHENMKTETFSYSFLMFTGSCL